jgi:hypothetical protein
MLIGHIGKCRHVVCVRNQRFVVTVTEMQNVTALTVASTILQLIPTGPVSAECVVGEGIGCWIQSPDASGKSHFVACQNRRRFMYC